MVGKPARRPGVVGNGREALPEGWEWSKAFSKGQEWSGMARKPFWRAGSDQKVFPKGWEWYGMVGMPSRRVEVGRKWSRGPPGGQGVVRSPKCRAGSGQEALLEGWEWLGGPPGG